MELFARFGTFFRIFFFPILELNLRVNFDQFFPSETPILKGNSLKSTIFLVE
jgi:hypothetical protein